MYRLILALTILAGSEALTRDEVASLKKKLLAVEAAAGQPPAGYAKDEESFHLPTDIHTQKSSAKYEWVSPSVSSRFSGGGEKKAKQSQEQGQKEYEKKMAEAIAKGDYEAVEKLGQELQQQAGRTQLAAIEGRKDPIEMRVELNALRTQAIDPDGVVYERPGMIALLVDGKDEKRNHLVVFFDPVALKDTKTLSRVDLRPPEGGVSKRTAVYNASMEFIGPAAEIKAWAQKVNVVAALEQIDSGR